MEAIDARNIEQAELDKAEWEYVESPTKEEPKEEPKEEANWTCGKRT